MWLGRLLHPLGVEQNQVHSQWARLMLVEHGDPTPSPLPSKCWTSGSLLEMTISLRRRRRNCGFPTGLPLGFHISGGSGAVKEIVECDSEVRPSRIMGRALKAVVEGACHVPKKKRLAGS